MKKHNLHTHTTFSDGDLQPERVIDELFKLDYEIVGITDHGFKRNINSVSLSKLDDYISNLRQLQKKEKKLKLLAGLEIDLSIKNGINPRELPFKKLNELDYLLFEVESLEPNDQNYGVRSISEVRDKLKIPVGLAHFYYNSPNYFEKVLKVLNEYDIFYELNTGHGISFIEDPFIENPIAGLLKKNEIALTVGTDLHTLRSLDYNNGRRTPDYAFEFIKKYNLKVHELAS